MSNINNSFGFSKNIEEVLKRQSAVTRIVNMEGVDNESICVEKIYECNIHHCKMEVVAEHEGMPFVDEKEYRKYRWRTLFCNKCNKYINIVDKRRNKK